MEDLVKAFTIFLKYGNPYAPTHCEHDIMYVYPGCDVDAISPEDTAALDELGFTPDDEFACDGAWSSYRFGSA